MQITCANALFVSIKLHHFNIFEIYFYCCLIYYFGDEFEAKKMGKSSKAKEKKNK